MMDFKKELNKLAKKGYLWVDERKLHSKYNIEWLEEIKMENKSMTTILGTDFSNSSGVGYVYVKRKEKNGNKKSIKQLC